MEKEAIAKIARELAQKLASAGYDFFRDQKDMDVLICVLCEVFGV